MAQDPRALLQKVRNFTPPFPQAPARDSLLTTRRQTRRKLEQVEDSRSLEEERRSGRMLVNSTYPQPTPFVWKRIAKRRGKLYVILLACVYLERVLIVFVIV